MYWKTLGLLVLSFNYGCSGGGSDGKGPTPTGTPPPKSSLGVSLTEEVTGPTCANGGQRIGFYLDSNGNGVRDPGEPLVTSQIVCNGAPGESTPIGISTSEADPTICPSGGKVLAFFLDSNKNGTWEQSERDLGTPQTMCNGKAGSNGRDALSAGPVGLVFGDAGGKCPLGAKGEKLTFFRDTNSNGSMDPNEPVLGEQILCDGMKGDPGRNGAAVGLAVAAAKPEECPAGGRILTFFTDSIPNGSRDPGESVLATERICHADGGVRPVQSLECRGGPVDIPLAGAASATWRLQRITFRATVFSSRDALVHAFILGGFGDRLLPDESDSMVPASAFVSSQGKSDVSIDVTQISLQPDLAASNVKVSVWSPVAAGGGMSGEILISCQNKSF